MRRATILFLLLAAVLPHAAAQQPEALLWMEETTHDFGDVPRRGGDLVWSFPYRNEGTAPLVITQIVTSCSCIKVSYPRKPLPPGGHAAIRITYEPHKNEPGSFSKVIQIYSNSADGRHTITVRGNSLNMKR